MDSGSGVDIAEALVTAVVWIRSLAQELLHASGAAKKKKKKKKTRKEIYKNYYYLLKKMNL